ncbi:MAG: DUF1674 domain-containing protein [Gammaproteobacteria bacterium]|nr:DUF1674 domain-containing protein [Gammaproteobacteria bacterium]
MSGVDDKPSTETDSRDTDEVETEKAPNGQTPPAEIGGRKGPEPVRYGDWEKNGRCIDF